MQFPDGPYYAWHIIASFENNTMLPPELSKHTNHFGQLDLLGKEITSQTVEPLLSLVQQKKVRNLYISPFVPDIYNDETHWRDLNDQIYCHPYTHGCGVMGFNLEKSIAYFKKLDQYILNYRRQRKIDDKALPYPPVIFESYSDMADAIKNMILTGTPDGSQKQPPAVSPSRRGVDPSLLCWIENVLQKVPETPSVLEKVTGLIGTYYIPGYPEFPDWLAPEPGNWSLLGDLPNLQVLFMPKVMIDSYDFLLKCSSLERVGLSHTNLSDSHVLENLPNVTYLDLPAAEFDDFSFLLKCRSLEIVDLSHTNFRDCSILAKMPELKRVLLPAERQLLHMELLAPLPIQVKPDPKYVRGKDIPPFELIEPQPAEPWDTKPPYTVLHIDCDGETFEGPEITEKVVKKLMKDIQKGCIDDLYLSLEYWGEDEILLLTGFGGDGAGLYFDDQEQPVFYTLYDPEIPWDSEDNDEDYNEERGKPATRNLKLAAECAAYFIKTGKLYPGAYWAKYYRPEL